MKKEKEALSCPRQTSIGGQALMEGIMMRGPKRTALAVRNTKGEIVVEEFETKGKDRAKFTRWPLIRGVFAYIDSMVVGYKCLMRSAELSGLEDIVEESPKKKKKREAAKAARIAEETTALESTEMVAPIVAEDPVEAAKAESIADAAVSDSNDTAAESDQPKEDKIPSWVVTLMMIGSAILASVLALGLFMYVPTKLYDLIAPHVGFLNGQNAALNSLWKSIFEGVLKIIILVGYMALISLMKDIRRTFMYHGAEHKTIFCYEAGLELTVENVRAQRRFHPRCGTSFLILMLLVSIFIAFFIDPLSIVIIGSPLPAILRTGVKLLLLPVTVGVGYELIKLAGKHDNLFTRIISAPGVWLQHITVFEPTDDMIECAITAVKEVIPNDESDRW